MIASTSRDFIFVKTRKTGGTSAEIVLSTWCSIEDTVTPISGEDEITRRGYGGRPQNFARSAWDELVFRAAIRTGQPGVIDRLRKLRRPAWRFYNHMPAHQIRAELPELWARAYKITVERDPFERIVSLAWHQLGRKGDPAPEAVRAEIDRIVATKSYLNFPHYTIDGKLAVNEVIPYEEMWERLADIAAGLGCSMPAKVPSAKARFRKNRAAAADVLSQQQKRQILRDAALEFEVLADARRHRAAGDAAHRWPIGS